MGGVAADMIILVDLDETLVNLVDKWVYYYNNKYGTAYKREELTEYGSIGDELWIEFLRIPGFHSDLPWLDPEAPKVLQKLRKEGHRIVIATAAVAWESAKDKYAWVHTHLRIPGLIDGMKDLVITRDKSLIRADVLVDDNPAYLKDFRGQTIVYDQPWNRTYDGASFRAFNWKDVLSGIRVLETDRSFYSGGCY